VPPQRTQLQALRKSIDSREQAEPVHIQPLETAERAPETRGNPEGRSQRPQIVRPENSPECARIRKLAERRCACQDRAQPDAERKQVNSRQEPTVRMVPVGVGTMY